MEGEKTGFSRGDFKVSEPFMSGIGGSRAFGNKDGSGETVDEEVALWLSVGIHGNEGIGGIHERDIENVIHDNETRFIKWLRLS